MKFVFSLWYRNPRWIQSFGLFVMIEMWKFPKKFYSMVLWLRRKTVLVGEPQLQAYVDRIGLRRSNKYKSWWSGDWTASWEGKLTWICVIAETVSADAIFNGQTLFSGRWREHCDKICLKNHAYQSVGLPYISVLNPQRKTFFTQN